MPALRHVAIPPFTVVRVTNAIVLLPRRTRMRTCFPAGCALPCTIRAVTRRCPPTNRCVTEATRVGGGGCDFGVGAPAGAVAETGVAGAGVAAAAGGAPPPEPGVPDVVLPVTPVTASVCDAAFPSSSVAVTTGLPGVASR